MRENNAQKTSNLMDRRSIIRSGLGLGAAAAIPGVASARSSAPAGGDDSDRVEVEVVSETKNHTIYRVDNKKRTSLLKFYTNGPKEGKVDHLGVQDRAGSDENSDIDSSLTTTDSVSTTDSDGDASMSTLDAEQMASIDGVEIVKRSENIDRGLGDYCTRDFCDGFTYEHGQTGFTVEFVDQISSFESNIIEEAIATLIEGYVATRWSLWMLGFVNVIAGTLFTIATGVSATVSPWDREKTGAIRGTRGVVELGVAESWDAHAQNLTNIQDNENAHIGSLDYRCGF